MMTASARAFTAAAKSAGGALRRCHGRHSASAARKPPTAVTRVFSKASSPRFSTQRNPLVSQRVHAKADFEFVLHFHYAAADLDGLDFEICLLDTHGSGVGAAFTSDIECQRFRDAMQRHITGRFPDVVAVALGMS